jgi:cell division septation protein DedD
MKKGMLVLAAILVSAAAFSQSVDTEVARMVRMLDEGKAQDVKSELPTMIAKYQSHPGVLYLQGRLALNGAEAAKYYQSVIDNFPKSEWADDALYYIYLYYSSLGLSRTADLKLQQLRKEYPNSPYLRDKQLTAVAAEAEEKPPVVVTPAVPPMEPRTDPMPRPSSSGGDYAIQVGAFSLPENASRLKSFFEELGYPVEIQNKVRDGRSFYLVWVGQFRTADEARRFAAEVRSKHKMESIVVSR